MPDGLYCVTALGAVDLLRQRETTPIELIDIAERRIADPFAALLPIDPRCAAAPAPGV